MKKIICLLLVLATLCSVSCKPRGNEPYNPYENGNTYGPGSGGPTEGDNPTVNNPDGQSPSVCDDYYNRYSLVDGVNIFLSEYGTLYWYDANLELCPKLCWADLSLRRDGYFIRVYRLVQGEMRQVEVLDTREFVCKIYNILLCDPKSPDYLYPRVIEVIHSSEAATKVGLRSNKTYGALDEYFFM